ncbi:MAG: serine/threonine-protein kinase [Actinomycetota bacterium]
MSSTLSPGTLLRDYRVEAPLGRGGQGIVYVAEHVTLRRRVALKVLPPDLATDLEFRERFLREARLAASLDHANILPVYDAGEADGVLFLAMRLVNGEDLAQLLAREGALEPGRTVSVLGRVASALDEAHARGLVHRDVKPSNILLELPDRVFLSDFGLGKLTGDAADVVGGDPTHPGSERVLTRAGYFVGTPHYAAPEQVQGGPVTGRTDEYALAAVLFECLTGRVPFPHDVETATLVAHVTDPPPAPSTVRPSLPAGLDDVVRQGMSKRPEDRFATCRELVDAARRVVGGVAPFTPPPPTMPGRPAPPSPPPAGPSVPAGAGAGTPAAFAPTPRRGLRPWMVGGIIGLVVALAGGTIFALSGGGGHPQPTSNPTTVAPSTEAPSTSASSGPPALTETTVTKLHPFDAGGELQLPFQVNRTAPGSCFSGSGEDDRPDAWKCFAKGDNLIHDPCFQNLPGKIPTSVACLDSPFSHAVLFINLTQPLPTGGNQPPGTPGNWAVVLADDDALCFFIGGQSGLIAGQRISMTCDDNRLVAGTIDRTKAVWTALVGRKGSNTLSTVPIKRAFW